MESKDYTRTPAFKYYLLVLAAALPSVCWGHPNHLGYNQYFHGFLHPLTGVDHTLAMIAVGIIAVEMADKKGTFWIGLLPLTFIAFMTVGGFLGYQNILLPWSEIGISVSVFVLGLCISFPNRLPTLLLLSLIGIFALCHGYAHGSEIPSDVHPAHYIIGFIGATALLHLMGIFTGKIFISHQNWGLRYSGLAMAASAFFI